MKEFVSDVFRNYATEALVKKNLIRKCRHPYTLLLELILPFIGAAIFLIFSINISNSHDADDRIEKVSVQYTISTYAFIFISFPRLYSISSQITKEKENNLFDRMVIQRLTPQSYAVSYLISELPFLVYDSLISSFYILGYDILNGTCYL